MLLQLPDGGQAVHRVPCETGEALGDDKVDFPGKGIGDHCFKSLAFFGVRRRDTFVRIYGCKLPIVPALDVIRVVIDLCLIACGLFLMVSRDTGISGDTPFLCAVNWCRCVAADRWRNCRHFSLCHASSPPSVSHTH